MNTGKQHILFPRVPIICPRVESEGVDNPAWALSPCVPAQLLRRKRIRLCRSNFVVAAKRLRNLRVANAGLSFDEGTREEPVKSTCPECRRRCVQTTASFRGCLDTSSARQPPFGVQACLRKDKPEGYGAASRPKGGCRARCADIPGASVSSPLRAEHVLSLSRPLQRLVCRGRELPSVGLPTGSVGRGRA
jgi:hypothetical protein